MSIQGKTLVTDGTIEYIIGNVKFVFKKPIYDNENKYFIYNHLNQIPIIVC